MADNCWLCEERESDIEKLKHEIEFLKGIISDDKRELARLRGLKNAPNIVSNFTVTVKDGNITIEPYTYEEED